MSSVATWPQVASSAKPERSAWSRRWSSSFTITLARSWTSNPAPGRTRDPVSVHAFHFDVPAGATQVELSYQFLTAVKPDVGRIEVTPDMLNVQWLQLGFYPAGYYLRGVQIEPSVKLPEGWGFGTALEKASTAGQTTTFKTTTFETMVDSPMFAGRYYKQVELDPGGPAPVRLNLVADRPEDLEIKPEQLQIHKNIWGPERRGV